MEFLGNNFTTRSFELFPEDNNNNNNNNNNADTRTSEYENSVNPKNQDVLKNNNNDKRQMFNNVNKEEKKPIYLNEPIFHDVEDVLFEDELDKILEDDIGNNFEKNTNYILSQPIQSKNNNINSNGGFDFNNNEDNQEELGTGQSIQKQGENYGNTSWNDPETKLHNNQIMDFSRIPVFNTSPRPSTSLDRKTVNDDVTRDISADSVDLFGNPFPYGTDFGNNDNSNDMKNFMMNEDGSSHSINTFVSDYISPFYLMFGVPQTTEGFERYSMERSSITPVGFEDLDTNERYASSTLSMTPKVEWGYSATQQQQQQQVNGENGDNTGMGGIQHTTNEYGFRTNLEEGEGRGNISTLINNNEDQKTRNKLSQESTSKPNLFGSIEKARTLKEALAEDFKTMDYISSLSSFSSLPQHKTKKLRSPTESPVQISTPRKKISPQTPQENQYIGEEGIGRIESLTPESALTSTRLFSLHKQLLSLLNEVAVIPVDDATSNNEADAREVRLDAANQFGLMPLREPQMAYLSRPLRELGTVQSILEGFEEEPFIVIPAPKPALVLRGMLEVLDAIVETVEGNKEADVEMYIQNLEGAEAHAARNATLFVMQSPSSQSSRYTRSAESITETVISMVARTPLCRDDLSKSSGFDRRRLSSILAPLKAMGALREVQYERDRSLSVSIQFLRSEDNVPIPVVNGERFFGQRLAWCPSFRRTSMNVNGFSRYLEHLRRANRVISSRLFATVSSLLQKMSREGREMYEDEVTRFPEELSALIERSVLLRLRRYNGCK